MQIKKAKHLSVGAWKALPPSLQFIAALMISLGCRTSTAISIRSEDVFETSLFMIVRITSVKSLPRGHVGCILCTCTCARGKEGKIWCVLHSDLRKAWSGWPLKEEDIDEINRRTDTSWHTFRRSACLFLAMMIKELKLGKLESADLAIRIEVFYGWAPGSAMYGSYIDGLDFIEKLTGDDAVLPVLGPYVFALEAQEIFPTEALSIADDADESDINEFRRQFLKSYTMGKVMGQYTVKRGVQMVDRSTKGIVAALAKPVANIEHSRKRYKGKSFSSDSLSVFKVSEFDLVRQRLKERETRLNAKDKEDRKEKVERVKNNAYSEEFDRFKRL